MSPLVTAAPVLIDAVTFAANSHVSRGAPGSGFASCSPGLKRWVFHLSGTVFFMVLQNATDQSQATGAAGVFLSTDGGTTWSRQDAANQPALGAGLSCYFQDGTSTIYVAFGDGAGHLFTSTINLMPTGATWGVSSAAASGGLTWRATSGTLHITRLSSGDVYLYYSINTPGTKLVGYQQKYSGGAWSAPAAFTTNGANFFCEIATVISDSVDRTLLLWTEVHTGTSNVMLCASVDSTGVVGAPLTVFDNATFGALGRFVFTGAPVILGAEFKIPAFFGQGLNATQMQMLTGTALPSPVWSLSTAIDPGASTVPAGAQLYGPYGGILDSAGDLWVFWIVAPFNTDTPPQQIWANKFSLGAWGVPVLVYDYALNQPGTAPIGSGLFQYILDMSVASGSFLIQATMPATVVQVVSGYALKVSPLAALSAQVVFQGVRRFKGAGPEIGYQGCVKPRSCTYVKTVEITVAANADGSPNGPVTLDFQVSDYDFDLYQVIITYSSAARVIPATQVIATVQVYDFVRQPISNIPMLDIFMNGAPGSPYENGAIVPPLRYPKNSRIRMDFFSLISDASLLPVNAKVHFVGMERRPA